MLHTFFCIELVVGWVPLSGWMACTHNGAFSAYPSRAEATIAHSCCVPGRWHPANNISHIYSNECCHLYWNRAIVSRFLWPKHCGCDIRSHALCHVAPTVDTFANTTITFEKMSHNFIAYFYAAGRCDRSHHTTLCTNVLNNINFVRIAVRVDTSATMPQCPECI